MIVDDEHFVRMGLIHTLPWKEYGFEIVSDAENGQQALARIRGEHVDVLFTDLTMPAMNGFELMEHVRAEFPYIWIVVLTCHQDFDYAQKAIQLGAIDYMVKTQMEGSKSAEMLERIKTRIEREKLLREATGGRGQTGDSKPTAVEEREEWLSVKYEIIRKDWDSLRWIYGNQQWRLWLDHVERLRPPLVPLLEMVKEWLHAWRYISSVGDWFEGRRGVNLAGYTWKEIVDLIERLRSGLREPSVTEDAAVSIYKAIKIMSDELHSNQIGMGNIARRVGLSRGYFSQCFRPVVGLTFHDLLTRFRIDTAKLLLWETNELVYTIAERAGFKDEKYFSKVFKQCTGILPTEYRNQLRVEK